MSIGILRPMPARSVGIDLEHPLAAWWVAGIQPVDTASGLTWAVHRGAMGEGLRRRIHRITKGRALDLELPAAGEAPTPGAGLWLVDDLALSIADGGHVVGFGTPGRGEACAPGHVQAVVRTVGLWATRFELRWLMARVQVGRGSAAASGRTLERALERSFPALAGKLEVQVEEGPAPVSELELHASFAGAPGTEALHTALRDARASAAWARHLGLADGDFRAEHALDRGEVWVEAAALRGLGPLARLRAWYDQPAVEASRALEFAAAQPPAEAARP